MYVKMFSTIYDGSLTTRGPWQALVTFQQMLVLADRVGVCDMTRDAISRRTIIPIEIITAGIEALEAPDPDSRGDEHEGRRIVRLAAHRDWGWQIANYEKYAKIRSSEERRDYMRNYMRERKEHAPKEFRERTPQAHRGCRLPEDFYPDAAGLALATELGVVATTALATFRDYWVAQPGQRGVKLDWQATWRNWIRKDAATPARAARADSGPPWWSSNEGIKLKGESIGMLARGGESWGDYKARIHAKLGTSHE